VLAAAGLVSAVTVANRAGLLSARTLAATQESLGDGRIWLLATSALVADRPAVASIAGLAVVGLAATALCGARVTWVAAALGHVCSALIVYVALDLVRTADAGAFGGAVSFPDYGTSAIVAAWIGAIACALWLRGRRAGAVALCVAAALVGWLCKGTLTILDTEHAVALAAGVAAVRLASVVDRARQVMRRVRLVERQPEQRVDLRDDHPELRRPQLVHALRQLGRRVHGVRAQLDLPR
jgi:hypothetical protein